MNYNFQIPIYTSKIGGVYSARETIKIQDFGKGRQKILILQSY